MRKHLLRPLLTAMFIVVALSVTATICWSQAASKRSDLRIFYTAPPAIPHETDDQIGDTCLMCHEELVDLGGGQLSVPTPHPQYTNCLQCHVTSSSHDGQDSPPTPTNFVGLEEPVDGLRVSDVAPPTIPHRMLLRENCLSCHHPEHPNVAQRCPHPERSNCLQCHVADAANEFNWK